MPTFKESLLFCSHAFVFLFCFFIGPEISQTAQRPPRKVALCQSYRFCVKYEKLTKTTTVSVTVLEKLKFSYVKCLKMFFNFHKYSSVSDMFVQIGLPSVGTFCHNAQWGFL